MKNKVCSCCKNEIIAKSIKADELYIICLESYDYHKGLENYDSRKQPLCQYIPAFV
jgi:hypothetical protein